jgi:hypothetical protein
VSPASLSHYFISQKKSFHNLFTDIQFCRNALRIVKDAFPEIILEDQDLFGPGGSHETILEFIPDDNPVKKELKNKWENDPVLSSEDKWVDLKEAIEGLERKSIQQVSATQERLRNGPPSSSFEVFRRSYGIL